MSGKANNVPFLFSYSLPGISLERSHLVDYESNTELWGHRSSNCRLLGRCILFLVYTPEILPVSNFCQFTHSSSSVKSDVIIHSSLYIFFFPAQQPHNKAICKSMCVNRELGKRGSGTNCLCMCKVPLITYILLHIHWKFTCGSAPCGFQVRSDNVLMLQLNTLHCIIFEAISKLQWERLCHSVVLACNRQLHRIPARNS